MQSHWFGLEWWVSFDLIWLDFETSSIDSYRKLNWNVTSSFVVSEKLESMQWRFIYILMCTCIWVGGWMGGGGGGYGRETAQSNLTLIYREISSALTLRLFSRCNADPPSDVSFYSWFCSCSQFVYNITLILDQKLTKWPHIVSIFYETICLWPLRLPWRHDIFYYLRFQTNDHVREVNRKWRKNTFPSWWDEPFLFITNICLKFSAY